MTLDSILYNQINPAVLQNSMDCAVHVYKKSPEKALKKAGLELVEQFDVNGTQAIIVATEKEFIIAMRGTDDLDSVYLDLKFVKTDFPGGGRVHSGCYEYYRQVEEPMARTLEALEPRPLIVAGHSLGWTAVMAGVTFGAVVAYSFGGLRIGNQEFCNRVNFPCWRFEHFTDPIPYLPPRIPIWGAIWALAHFRKPTFYDHPGVAIPIDGSLHRMVHYRKSVGKFIKELEKLSQRDGAVL